MSSTPTQISSELIKDVTTIPHPELIKLITAQILKGNYQYADVWEGVICYHRQSGWSLEGSTVIKNYLQTVPGKLKTLQANGNELTVCGMVYHFAQLAGKQKSYKEAQALYNKAAELGNSRAMNNLGVMYKQGHGVPIDYKQAINCYEKAAKLGKLGNASAMNNLGFMYYKGQGVPIEYKQAITCYEKAAKLSNASAMNNLGFMYYKGQGVQIDYKQAITYYQKAAKLGNASAMNNLGFMYYNGHGVWWRKYKQVINYYEQAAKLGSASAMLNLGSMYYEGLGVRRDYKQAINYFEKAAELGNARALYNLGVMYKQGYGVFIAISQAARCYRLAAGEVKEAIDALQTSKAPVVFSYHAAMQKNEIVKAANLVVKYPKLIEELKEFDCMRINGKVARDKVANLIQAIGKTVGFKKKPELVDDVNKLKRYIETPPSLVTMAVKTLFNNNIDYSFLSPFFKKQVGMPKQPQKASEEKSSKCVLQ